MSFVSKIKSIALSCAFAMGASAAIAAPIGSFSAEGTYELSSDGSSVNGIFLSVSPYSLTLHDPFVDTSAISDYELFGSITIDGSTESGSLLFEDTSIDNLVFGALSSLPPLPPIVFDAFDDALALISTGGSPTSLYAPTNLAGTGLYFGFDNVAGPSLTGFPTPSVEGAFDAFLGFTATPDGSGQTGSFAVSLEFSDVSVVPLPAGLPLLVVGLGAFGVVGRRRKNAA